MEPARPSEGARLIDLLLELELAAGDGDGSGRGVRWGIGGQDLELEHGAGLAANHLHQIRQCHVPRVHERAGALRHGEYSIPRVELSAQFGGSAGQQPVDDRHAVLHSQLGANSNRRYAPNGLDGIVSLCGIG